MERIRNMAGKEGIWQIKTNCWEETPVEGREEMDWRAL